MSAAPSQSDKSQDHKLPFQLRFARDVVDLRAAQRLRYRVFVEELGSDGEMVDHAAQLEADRFDPDYEHLMLIDPARSEDPLEQCVAVYRLLPGEKAAELGRFYSEGEYDLTPLKASGKRLLELGRSCVAKDYRGGMALFEMWAGLAKYVIEEGYDVLFGTASFFGADVRRHAEALSWLHHNHLAPEALRARSLPEHFQSMDLVPLEEIDRKRAMLAIPPLIKAYLRLGGTVGEGAFVDEVFNTVDVLLILDTAMISPRQRAMYTKGLGA
ncbi:GNAT family N-acetyltransferase [Celeribacter ethanolicus]|uniref:GNAT family N-acetyltransferase n=1 Tax=Celeribacter ethanolicus TaxID=1758178 RepID=UPI000834AACC|nr:GNAT family N-acyltransferase [Celeribacter ethanolicus]